MSDKPQTLTELLEEFRGKTFVIQALFGKTGDYEVCQKEYDKSVAQAKSAIEEMFGECLPKNDIKSVFERYFSGKIVPFAVKGSGENGVKASDAINAVVEAITNCKQEIRNRVKEIK
jgi:hypothetical protein